MSENIIKFPGQTIIDLPAGQILDAAKEQPFDSLFLVGMTEDGDFYLAGTTSDMGTVSLIHRRMGAAIDEFLKEIMR